MKLSYFSFLLISLTLLTNCKKEEVVQEVMDTENKEIYFSYRLSDKYTIEDSWLIIHDTEGNLLDYKPFVNRAPLEFRIMENIVPERLNITLLTIRYESSGSTSHYLQTYTDIKKGSAWYENIAEITEQLSFSGTFNVTVTNVPGVEGVAAFTADGKLRQINYTVGTESDGSKSMAIDRLSLATDKEYLISIRDTDGNLKYTKLTPTTNLEQLVVDYGNFLEYDSYLEMELPLNHSFYSQGYLEESPNFYTHVGFGKNGLSYSENDIVNNMATVGYLDSFEKFKTGFSANLGEYDYGYIITGAKMEYFNLPESPSVEIVNESAVDFYFSSSRNLVREYSYWNSEENLVNGQSGFTSLHVNSTGENGHKLGPLPDEITEKYPSLSIDSLHLSLLEVYTKSSSYDEYMETTTTTFEDKREGETEYFLLKYFASD